MLLLAGLMLVLLLVPGVDPHISATGRRVLDVGDLGIWACFVAEFVLLLALAPSRKQFLRTHIPELILVVVPVLRPLRLLQLSRGLRVMRVGTSAGVVFRDSRHSLATRGVAYASAVTVTLMLVSAVLMVDLERGHPGANISSLGTSLWWAAVTVTTIGYGDHFPVTAAGRLVAVVLSASGIALVGVITAAVAAWFVRGDERAVDADIRAEEGIEKRAETDLAEVHARLDQLTDAVTNLTAMVSAAYAVGAVPKQPARGQRESDPMSVG